MTDEPTIRELPDDDPAAQRLAAALGSAIHRRSLSDTGARVAAEIPGESGPVPVRTDPEPAETAVAGPETPLVTSLPDESRLAPSGVLSGLQDEQRRSALIALYVTTADVYTARVASQLFRRAIPDIDPTVLEYAYRKANDD